MKLYEKYETLLLTSGINTKLRLAHFIAQIHHESNLKPISENLNYSSAGLLNTFHKYFNGNTALEYQRQPEKIANKVYANRMGNSNENSGEGWKYRGRGFIQITGKENYFRCANDMGIDCLKNPDLLLQEPNAMISAIWFWNTHGCSLFADNDDIISITKKINGGINGIDDRKRLLQNYKDEFGV